MIPNLTLLVAAYVIFRCAQVMADEARREDGRLEVQILGFVTIVIAGYVVLTTFMMAAEVGTGLGGLM